MQAIRVRHHSTTRSGTGFSVMDKWVVWQNARMIPGRNPALWRQDACGAYMYWNHYGNTNSLWGWEIDHIMPVALGGSDAWANLQALHWKNNREKSDSVGRNYCVITYRT